MIAPADYFRLTDSDRDEQIYKDNSNFLPYVNNEIYHQKKKLFKQNLLKLNRLGLALFEFDSTIYPKWSEQFCDLDRDGKLI
jgi:hypothetical protein